MHRERTYRNLVSTEKLIAFQVVVKETDLLVHAERKLEQETRELVLEHRGYLESYIGAHPDFTSTLTPWRLSGPVPAIVADMVRAGANAGVGPMAAVAGAIAEHTGMGLLNFTRDVIVENGGDVFIKTSTPLTVGIFAGKSPLSLRVGIRLGGKQKPVAVCTSSGTVGHSLSLGKADAVCVVADSCSIADAAATAIGNRIQSSEAIESVISKGKRMDNIKGILIIIGDKIGMWGDLEVIPLKGKKA
jgi:ApbE superfamily uncharacterized protein (UPF0280 family)